MKIVNESNVVGGIPKLIASGLQKGADLIKKQFKGGIPKDEQEALTNLMNNAAGNANIAQQINKVAENKIEEYNKNVDVYNRIGQNDKFKKYATQSLPKISLADLKSDEDIERFAQYFDTMSDTVSRINQLEQQALKAKVKDKEYIDILNNAKKELEKSKGKVSKTTTDDSDTGTSIVSAIKDFATQQITNKDG